MTFIVTITSSICFILITKTFQMFLFWLMVIFSDQIFGDSSRQPVKCWKPVTRWLYKADNYWHKLWTFTPTIILASVLWFLSFVGPWIRNEYIGKWIASRHGRTLVQNPFNSIPREYRGNNKCWSRVKLASFTRLWNHFYLSILIQVMSHKS